MTAWSRERPTKEGYYWWRKDGDIEILQLWDCAYLQVSQMYNEEGFQSEPLDAFLREYADGEWQGPLEPKE